MKKIAISQKKAFIICALILAASAAGKKVLINSLQIYLRKEPIELKAAFDDFSEDKLALGGYKVTQKAKITNKDIERELGTTEYLIWELEDLSVDDRDEARFCSLFITYYTGINDRIPHVPEECYFGTGNRVKGFNDVDAVIDVGGNSKEFEYRKLTFTSTSENIWGGTTEFSVCYLLRVNGRYAGNRTSARNIMARNLFGKYSYFSKVEWRFQGKYGLPDGQKTIEASQKLLETILPILEQDHWPDIENKS
jgi:hypothetical protein